MGRRFILKYIREDVREQTEYFCDCKGCVEKSDEPLPVKLEFSYGSKFDGDMREFCSDECLRQWVVDKIRGPS